jgi:transcriptional regulator with XRE-family HTH domain
MTSREAFGPELRRQREQRGVTLESIAKTTRISRSLFAALERNDLSRWPGGLYRRSFFRAYLEAIDLPPEPLLLELARFFPEPGHAVSDSLAPDDDAMSFRLALVPEARWTARARRGLAAALDTGTVLLVAYGLAAFTGANVWTMGAGVGLSYYALCTVCLGESFTSWCLTSGWLPHRTPQPTSRASELAALREDWLSQVLGPPLASIGPPAQDSRVETSA